MTRRPLSIWAALSLLALLGCGGAYTDDPHNFDRIFHVSKPGNVSSIHSRYWKSAHWSNEYEAYIEFESPRPFVDALIKSNSFVHTNLVENSHWADTPERPEWFMPGSLMGYEEWAPGKAGDFDERCLYRRKSDGHWFYFDRQF